VQGKTKDKGRLYAALLHSALAFFYNDVAVKWPNWQAMAAVCAGPLLVNTTPRIVLDCHISIDVTRHSSQSRLVLLPSRWQQHLKDNAW